MTRRVEKKSETIEVRVSYTEKLAFMEACRQAGTTASHAIRGYIDNFLHPKPELRFREKLVRALPVSSALVLLMLAGAFILLQVMQPSDMAYANGVTTSPTMDRVVRFFDKNSDGFISAADLDGLEEEQTVTLTWLIEKGDTNGDRRISTEELATLTEMTIEMRSHQPRGPDTGGVSSGGKKHESIILIPPGLSKEERKAYLEKSDLASHMSEEDLVQFKKMLDVFFIEDTE